MNFLKYFSFLLIILSNSHPTIIGRRTTYCHTNHGTYRSESIGGCDYIYGPDGYHGVGHWSGNSYYYNDNDWE